MALNPQLDRHKLLLTTIADHIGSAGEEYDKFVEHFKGYVPRGLLSAKKNLLDKFEALATKGHLGPGKYEVLKKISKDSGNIDILDLIEEAEEDIRNLDNPTTGVDKQDLIYSRREERGYYNNTGKKGLLLIINFIENTKGTELDEDILKAFSGPDGLDFEIEDPREGKQEDLTKGQVETALESVRDKLNRNDSKCYYCFVCIVLSHDNEEELKTRDEIIKSFDGRNIPNFKGRPKVFLNETFRGSEEQRGQHVDNAYDEVTPNAAENNYKDEAHERIYIPTDADTLTVYITNLGNKSGRRDGTSSCFTTEFMKVITKCHKQDHVEEMLIKAQKNFALKKGDGTKPCLNSTLTSRLMLTKSKLSQNMK